jgi:ribosomal protein S18 acetylase RimI-like enzyme
VNTHHELDRKRFFAATRDTPAGYAHFLGTQLTERNVVILVAAEDDRVVGYAYAALEGRDWMALRGEAGALYDIIVDPGMRGRGIGRLLLDATIARLKALGAPQVVLSTADRNEPAQRLFAGAGFRRTMIEMTRDLDDGH